MVIQCIFPIESSLNLTKWIKFLKTNRIRTENPEVAELLIQNDADIDLKNNDNVFPLHRAADHGYEKVAALLVKNGANVNCLDNYEWTPLQFSAQSGSFTIHS